MKPTATPRPLDHRRAAVLARSYGVYRAWCEANGVTPGRDALYVARPAELAGWTGPIVKTPGWDAHRSTAELRIWHHAELLALAAAERMLADGV